MDQKHLEAPPPVSSERLRTPYPEIEPYRTHRLQVGDGHTLYVEECGNPIGIPVIYLHGGPGYRSTESSRRFFDPKKYRVVLFDQRGCGRSTPFASIEANTTDHLVADIEKIRTTLGVERWIVFGGSWGSTLALVYAIRNPDQVAGLILRGIFLGTRREVRAFYQEGRPKIFFPDEWREYVSYIPRNECHDLLRAYHRRLCAGGAVAEEAAGRFAGWEDVCSQLVPQKDAPVDHSVAFSVARIEAHYFVSDCFLPPDYILDNARWIVRIPTIVVQGRYDLVCPAQAAYDLVRAIVKPGKMHPLAPCELHLVEGAGHASSEPGITDRLVRATDQFADWRERGIVKI